MPFVAATVEIPEGIRHILLKYAKSRRLPARQVQRAKIILPILRRPLPKR